MIKRLKTITLLFTIWWCSPALADLLLYKNVTLHFLHKSTHNVVPVVFSKECTEYHLGTLRIRLLDAHKSTEGDLVFNWVFIQIDAEQKDGCYKTLFKGWTNNYAKTFEHPDWFFKIYQIMEA